MIAMTITIENGTIESSIENGTDLPSTADTLILSPDRRSHRHRSNGDIDFGLVAFDLYRDIHKGIRAELFAVTSAAGSVDPSDRCGLTALADHVAAIKDVLELHAEHEDTAIDLGAHLPELADRIEADHHVLDARIRGCTSSPRTSSAPPPSTSAASATCCTWSSPPSRAPTSPTSSSRSGS